jgi:hypothetical protein
MSFFRYSMTGPLELLVFGSKSTPRELTYKVLFASLVVEKLENGQLDDLGPPKRRR